MLNVSNFKINNEPINDFSISKNGIYVLSGKYALTFFSLLISKPCDCVFDGLVQVNNVNVLTLNDITRPVFKYCIYQLNVDGLSHVVPNMYDSQIETAISFAINNGYSYILADFSSASFELIKAFAAAFKNKKRNIAALIILPSNSNVVVLNCEAFNDEFTDKSVMDGGRQSIDAKKDLVSYFVLFKRYVVHFLFVLVFAICSCVGWFFYGFYKSPYNYYSAAEAQMTETQIQERIAKGEPMSWDFTPGWITALLISIMLTIICLYGIYNFRKVVLNSKSYSKAYESKTQFLMFVLIMLFAFFLTGVGILIYYELDPTSSGFYYGNADSFFMLFISVLLEMLMIFLPHNWIFIKKKKENKEK